MLAQLSQPFQGVRDNQKLFFLTAYSSSLLNILFTVCALCHFKLHLSVKFSAMSSVGLFHYFV